MRNLLLLIFALCTMAMSAQTETPDSMQMRPPFPGDSMQVPPPPPGDSLRMPPHHPKDSLGRHHRGGPQRHPRFTVAQINERMTSELNLNQDQIKKVEKLNKKNSTLIEGVKPKKINGAERPEGGFAGGGRMGGHGGGPGGMGAGDMGGGPGGGMGGPPPGGMGGGRGGMGPGGGMGGPGGGFQKPEDIQDQMIKAFKKQDSYDEKLQKILTPEQWSTFNEKIRPDFASQWQLKEFIWQDSAPYKQQQ